MPRLCRRLRSCEDTTSAKFREPMFILVNNTHSGCAINERSRAFFHFSAPCNSSPPPIALSQDAQREFPAKKGRSRIDGCSAPNQAVKYPALVPKIKPKSRSGRANRFFNPSTHRSANGFSSKCIDCFDYRSWSSGLAPSM